MRSVAGIGLLLLAAVAVVGCDSDDPARVGNRNSDVFFTAAGAEVPLYAVWKLSPIDEDDNPLDLDGDGDIDTTLYCELETLNAGVPDAPWAFSAVIKVLVDGEIGQRTVVSSVLAPAEYDDPSLTNITPYDTTATEGWGSATNLSATKIDITVRRGLCTGNFNVSCDLDDPDAGTNDCLDWGQLCVSVGVCDDPGSTFECVVGSTNPSECTTTGSRCDCTNLDPFVPWGVTDWGICCTTDNIPSAECPDIAWVNHCSARGNNGVRGQRVACQPGCSEEGEGDACIEPEVTYGFRDAQILSSANRTVLASTDNFINELDPSQAPTDDPPAGVCPGFDYGDPGIQGGGQPYSLSLGNGDTILVEARRLREAPPGMLLEEPGGTELGERPAISSQLFVDGKPISPDGSVTTSKGGDSGGGAIDYKYTSR